MMPEHTLDSLSSLLWWIYREKQTEEAKKRMVERKSSGASDGQTVDERCPAASPEGEQCKYKLGHDASGEPHSWTLFGFGLPLNAKTPPPQKGEGS